MMSVKPSSMAETVDARPQRSQPVQGLDQGPGPPGHQSRPSRMRRRAAVEPAIGRLKDDHRMRRNYLKGREAAHRARCRRLQLRPASALVGGMVIACPVMILCRGLPPLRISETLFTGDCAVSLGIFATATLLVYR